MNWNYRIIKEKSGLSLCAVYYEDWEIIGYADSTKLEYFSNKKDMHHSFNLMSEAFDRPILNVKDIK